MRRTSEGVAPGGGRRPLMETTTSPGDGYEMWERWESGVTAAAVVRECCFVAAAAAAAAAADGDGDGDGDAGEALSRVLLVLAPFVSSSPLWVSVEVTFTVKGVPFTVPLVQHPGSTLAMTTPTTPSTPSSVEEEGEEVEAGEEGRAM